MGNTESFQKRNRQSSYSGMERTDYNKISTLNSWNDFDNKLVSGIQLEELTDEEKQCINKKKLCLLPEYSNLTYQVKYFTQRVQPSQENPHGEQQLLGDGRAKNNRYEGTFKNGQLFGQGIYFYPTGSIYMGGIKDNGRDGNGVFYFANGNIYSGQWKSNDQNGVGKFFFVQEGKLFQFYSGNFRNSLYTGFGCYCYQNKYYIGYWKNDKYDGQGKIYSFDGKLLKSGEFKQDKLITDIPEYQIEFPQNWDTFLPNFSKEMDLYKYLLENKPIV